MLGPVLCVYTNDPVYCSNGSMKEPLLDSSYDKIDARGEVLIPEPHSLCAAESGLQCTSAGSEASAFPTSLDLDVKWVHFSLMGAPSPSPASGHSADLLSLGLLRKGTCNHIFK